MRGGLENFLVVGHIVFEVVLPVSCFLMLQMQAMECFLQNIQFVVD